MTDRYIVVMESEAWTWGKAAMQWSDGGIGSYQFYHAWPVGPKHPLDTYDLATAKKLVKRHHAKRRLLRMDPDKLIIVKLNLKQKGKA